MYGGVSYLGDKFFLLFVKIVQLFSHNLGYVLNLSLFSFSRKQKFNLRMSSVAFHLLVQFLQVQCHL